MKRFGQTNKLTVLLRCAHWLEFLPKQPLQGRPARQVPCPGDHYVGTDSVCKLGSSAGFCMKHDLTQQHAFFGLFCLSTLLTKTGNSERLN